MQVKIPKQYQNLATVELVLKGVLLHALASAAKGEVDDRNLGLCHTDAVSYTHLTLPTKGIV